MARSLLIALVVAVLAVLTWSYRDIWAVDPLSVPAASGGWAETAGSASASKSEKATFAGGCFWGVESIFRKVPGVIRTRVGYTGGSAFNPTYLDVASQRSGHAEAIDIEFDPAVITYQKLLDVFFNSHDPTVHGPSEYRSEIFYHSPEQEQAARQTKQQLDESGEYVGPITTAIAPAGTFFPAEEYHQRYYESRGDANHFCNIGNGKKVRALDVSPPH